MQVHYFRSLKINVRIHCQSLECSHNGQCLLAWASAHQYDCTTLSSPLSCLKEQLGQNLIDNRENYFFIFIFALESRKIDDSEFRTQDVGRTPGFIYIFFVLFWFFYNNEYYWY